MTGMLAFLTQLLSAAIGKWLCFCRDRFSHVNPLSFGLPGSANEYNSH